MFGGLGQLCDGVLGGNDFMESKELRVWPGYDYMGWSQDVLGQPAVDIEFHFEKTRIFHTMQVSVRVSMWAQRVSEHLTVVSIALRYINAQCHLQTIVYL